MNQTSTRRICVQKPKPSLSIEFFGFTLIIVLNLLACQTFRPEEQSKDEIVLENQLAAASSFIDNGEPQKALNEIKPLLLSHPDDAGVNNVAGLTQMALRNDKKALFYFKRAFSLDHSPTFGVNLAAALSETGQHDAGEKVLLQLLKQSDLKQYRYPERIFHNLAKIKEKQNQFKTAEKYYRRAISENPTYYLTKFQLAKLYDKTKRPALALHMMEEAQTACPVCPEPVEELVKKYMVLGKNAQARTLIQSFVKTDGVPDADIVRMKKLASDVDKITPAQIKNTMR